MLPRRPPTTLPATSSPIDSADMYNKFLNKPAPTQAPYPPPQRAPLATGMPPTSLPPPPTVAANRPPQPNKQALAQALLAKLPRAAQASMAAELAPLQQVTDEAAKQNALDSVLAKYSTMLQGGGRAP